MSKKFDVEKKNIKNRYLKYLLLIFKKKSIKTKKYVNKIIKDPKSKFNAFLKLKKSKI